MKKKPKMKTITFTDKEIKVLRACTDDCCRMYESTDPPEDIKWEDPNDCQCDPVWESLEKKLGPR